MKRSIEKYVQEGRAAIRRNEYADMKLWELQAFTGCDPEGKPLNKDFSLCDAIYEAFLFGVGVGIRTRDRERAEAGKKEKVGD